MTTCVTTAVPGRRGGAGEKPSNSVRMWSFHGHVGSGKWRTNEGECLRAKIANSINAVLGLTNRKACSSHKYLIVKSDIRKQLVRQ